MRGDIGECKVLGQNVSLPSIVFRLYCNTLYNREKARKVSGVIDQEEYEGGDWRELDCEIS